MADIIWARLGDVANYVEPFFGSGAVLLSRPHEPRVETINDADHFVANFWRAVKKDPEAVANHADWPVNETDLHARHWWLLTEGRDLLSAIEGNPSLYDAKIAGWWVWGVCASIGGVWCFGDGPWQWTGDRWAKRGRCIDGSGCGVRHCIPHLGDSGRGINRKVSDGCSRSQFILDWMRELSNRLRDVRVCAGDWSRISGPAITHGLGLTGVFLDPPYSDTSGRYKRVYTTDNLTVAHNAREWAIAEGANPLMRIVFAGYDGEHDFPENWEVVRWKAHGGFGCQGDGRGRANSGRETLWFSPHCIRPDRTMSLFDFAGVAERAIES